MEFLLLFLFRTASGVQNGLGYAREEKWRLAFSLIFMAMLGLATLGFINHHTDGWVQKWICYALLLITMAAIGGVEDSFNTSFKVVHKDIHLHETIFGYAMPFTFILAGANMYWVLASTYPAMILHKMAINIGSGQKWNYNGTDDPTGKTFSIPTLSIKIKRSSFRTRIILAAISITAFVFTWAMDYKLTVWPFVIKF